MRGQQICPLTKVDDGRSYVRLRASGRVLTERATRDRLIDGFLAKVEEWVERSHGVRADIVHDKLLAQGYEGSERTSRRAVARAKRSFVSWIRSDA